MFARLCVCWSECHDSLFSPPKVANLVAGGKSPSLHDNLYHSTSDTGHPFPPSDYSADKFRAVTLSFPFLERRVFIEN